MQSDYPVHWQNTSVGYATLTRQGMYYLIIVQIQGSIPHPFHLMLFTNGAERDLGICPRTDNGFGISVRIPVSGIDLKDLRFQISSTGKNYRFYPMDPKKPVAFLAELKNARFATNNAKPGILIKNIKD